MERGEYPRFHPYNNVGEGVDLPNANRLRRENLYSYLKSLIVWPSIVVLGEAPGWRGCRFSGVPFTSEAQLVSGELPFSGVQTSSGSSPYSEVTATTFWRVMRPYHPQFIAWNCIPLHPHQTGEPLSNRSPTKVEISHYVPLLAELIALIEPKQIIAVGKSAQKALLQIGLPCTTVRHPGYGGSRDFEIGMARILQSFHIQQTQQV